MILEKVLGNIEFIEKNTKHMKRESEPLTHSVDRRGQHGIRDLLYVQPGRK